MPRATLGKWHLGAEPYSPLQHGFDVDIPHWHGPGPAGKFCGSVEVSQLQRELPQRTHRRSHGRRSGGVFGGEQGQAVFPELLAVFGSCPPSMPKQN